MTPDRKEIIHCIKNLSANSHTANFLADQLNDVITEVGAENFAAIVSDHASACAAAKKKIAERYKHILPIRCIAHHVNLISTDICKTTFAKDIISKCQKIVKYFKQSHQAGEELRSKVLNEIVGGGLKSYVVTRWTTAWDCTNSILRLEQILKNVRRRIYYIIMVKFHLNYNFSQDCEILDESPEKLSTDISELIRSRSFFTNVKAVNTLLEPVKSVVKSLEFKTTTLADCFVELIKLSQKIKSLPPVSDYDFKYQCVERFNKRWKEFDIQLYLLAYILHPHYRGKGLRPTVLRNVYILAMEIWINMGGSELSSADLISQIQSFYLRKEEYNIPFSTNKALKILAITPHNAGCERVFSVLLKVEKLEAMAKLHTHYIINAQKELKYAYAGVSEDDFQSSIREALSEANKSDDINEDDDGDEFFDDDDNDYNDDDDDNGGGGNGNGDGNDEGDNEKGNHDPKIPNLRPNQRDIDIERWVDINDSELKRLLNIEVNVVIEPHPLPVINHGSNVFDIEATVDKILVIYLFQTIIEQHTGDIEEINISPQEIVDLIIVDEVEVELLFFVERQTLGDQDEPYLHNKELGRRTLGNEPGLGCVLGRRTLENESGLGNNAEPLETRRTRTWNDAELLEGGLTLEERRTNYTNQTLVKGSWTANTLKHY
ncbi:hypothetical protein RhiirA1_474320 [Rhizophagus irregularis]|uniref:DUF659 domain-containing protein n=1 Tax=Rhizophagus irregularis TaxID=588596 RepID=A0A2N0QYT5_9GLOM|nr:hypothetical protein RhiirA1_474320 [Rhizophagus irregularis]